MSKISDQIDDVTFHDKCINGRSRIRLISEIQLCYLLDFVRALEAI